MSTGLAVKKKQTTPSPKMVPHSIDAERSLLGGLMIDNTVWDAVASKVGAEDFYRIEHQILFRSIEQLARQDQPFDVVTVTEALKSIDKLDNVGGELGLFELANNTPSVANVVAYAKLVREKSVLRQLIQISNEIADSAFNTEGRSNRELLDVAETKIFSIAEQTAVDAGPRDIQSLLTEAVEKVDTLYRSKSAITGISSGFKDIDDMTSGLQRSELIIIAGRPSMGKTAIMMNIAEHVAIQAEQPVLVFSMEMPGSSLAMRMMSSLGRINQQDLRTGKLTDQDWPRVTSAVSILSQANLFIDDTPALSPNEVKARARRLMKERGQLALIAIDYLQLMRVPGYGANNRVGEISEISRSLKSLAKELKVPVIAASQLNRGLEQRTDKRPVMSDLRESGAIEQDADLIGFIYRDEVYNDESPDKGTAEFIIAKQRNGPIGKVRLSFLGPYTRFEDLAYAAYDAASEE